MMNKKLEYIINRLHMFSQSQMNELQEEIDDQHCKISGLLFDNNSLLRKIELSAQENAKLNSEINNKDLYISQQITLKDEYINKQLTLKDEYINKQINDKEKHIRRLEQQIVLNNSIIENLKEEKERLQGVVNEIQFKIIKQQQIKVVVYGSDFLFERLIDLINDNIELVGFASNSFESKFSTFSLANISQTDFDFLIIADSNTTDIVELLDIPKYKILNLYQIVHNYKNDYYDRFSAYFFYSFLYYRMQAAIENNEIEVCVTGLSYPLKGISEEHMKHKCIKLTSSSQDLYYDSLIISSVLQKCTHIKYWIMGLAYYSFDFDIKYGSEAKRILDTFYPLFEDSHGYNLPAGYGTEKKTMYMPNHHNIILNSIIRNFPFSISKSLGLSPIPEFDKAMWNNEGFLFGASFNDFSETQRFNLAQQRVTSHNQLNHPETEKEYYNILSKILDIFKTNNIAPIFVIFPATQYYRRYFDRKIIDRFYITMDKLRVHYQFQLIDMFDSNLFSLDDFLDWDHLNETGAKKMTNLLNDMIQW